MANIYDMVSPAKAKELEKTTMLEMVGQEKARELTEFYGEAKTPEDQKTQLSNYKASEAMLLDLLRTDSGARKYARIDMKEAVHTADFKILFNKVVRQVLQKPKEANYIGQQLLAKTVNIDGAKTIEVPTLGAIVAYELGETQEPQEQDPSFVMHATEIKARRYGLKLEIANDVIKYSQWDILGLYIEQAGLAMIRKKEELLFNEFTNFAHTAFDNTSHFSSDWTTGKGSNGTSLNGTFSHFDLIEMMAQLAANGYNPTDVLVHPLAWSIFALDPMIRFQLLHNSMGVTMGKFDGMADTMNAAAYVPFGLNVVVSPFATIGLNSTLTAGVTGQGAANYTSISVLDRQNAAVIWQQTPMEMIDYENVLRQIQGVMFHERYGIGLLNLGRAVVTAKNVRIDRSYEPVYSVLSV